MEDDEKVKRLREKHQELMKMRESISEMRTGAGTQTVPEEDEDEPPPKGKK